MINPDSTQVLNFGITSPAFRDGQATSPLSNYKKWLNAQPLSPHTKRNYVSQVERFLFFAGRLSYEQGCNFFESKRHRSIAEDYHAHLRNSANSKPTSINTSLTAIANFYRFLGLSWTAVKRERPLSKLPRILTIEEKAKLLQVVDACVTAKERAIMLLFLSTGIRLSECAALNICDVFATADPGALAVYSQKTQTYRKVPFDEATRMALLIWLGLRDKRLANVSEQALFINTQGQRMSNPGIDMIVRKIGILSGLVLSAQVLRDTFLTDVARQSNNAFIVAAISGHTSLNTTRKYFELAFSNHAS